MLNKLLTPEETQAVIRNHMDKVMSEASKIKGAEITQVKDANGLDAIKVTFDSGILFNTGKSELAASSKQSLNELATVMKGNRDLDVSIIGYTDNMAFRGSSAEESVERNKTLSYERAASVAFYLQENGVDPDQFKEILGKGQEDPVASNDTEEGRRQNRRVEIYLYASQNMINAAAAGKLR